MLAANWLERNLFALSELWDRIELRLVGTNIAT